MNMTWEEFVKHIEKELKLIRPEADLNKMVIAYMDVNYPDSMVDITVGTTRDGGLVITS
jgi:hypothetical protein